MKILKSQSKPSLILSSLIVSSLLILGVFFTLASKKETSDKYKSSKNPLEVNTKVPDLDVKTSIYTIDAQTGGEINHLTGSKISIPSQTFISKQGELISGLIEIHYREFHNQLEIFGSGIPMEYNSGGQNMVFESAGMIEIYGIQKGDTLDIAANQELTIKMCSNNAEQRFNLYYLNEDKQWEDKGKDSVIIEKIEETKEVSKPENKSEIIEKEELKIAQIKKEIKTLIQNKPVKPIQANPKTHSFKVDVLKEEFPELASYQNSIFELVSNEDFRPEYYKTEWDGIQLSKSKSNYILNLFKGDTSTKLRVIPVFEGKNYTNAIKEFEKKYDVYSRELKERKAEEHIAEKEFKKKMLEAKGRKERAAEARRVLNQRNNPVGFNNNPNSYWGQPNSKTVKELNKIYRQFNIKKSGVWNSDQPLSTGKKRIPVDCFVDESNKPIAMNMVSVIELTRNRVINIVHWEQLLHNPKIKSIVIGITSGNKIVYSQELNSINSKRIKVKELDAKYGFQTIKNEFLE